MTTVGKGMTADELLALPDDGKRYELVRGELIAMAPASDDHGFIGDALSWRIGAFVREHRLGRGRLAETGFRLGLDTVLAPDYAYISYERMPSRPSRRGYVAVAPDLVVEVVSLNDRASEVESKIGLWLAAGVRLVLVVYPEREEIVAHREDGTALRYGMGDVVSGEPALPGFAVAVADVFRY